ncbi:MAG: hypothetical protein U0790_11960 [Isosphaeraceae bacterium]
MCDREHPTEDDLTALEARLRSWQPDPGTLDRERMLFQAGQATTLGASRPILARLAWPAVAGLAACLALALGLAWQSERSRRQSLEVVLAGMNAPRPVESPAPPALARDEAPAPAGSSYLTLTRRLNAPEPAPDRVPPRPAPGRRNPSRSAPGTSTG